MNSENIYSKFGHSKGTRQLKEGYPTVPESIMGVFLSYSYLRRTLGFLGIFLPIILYVLGSCLNDKGRMLPSISDYYYTSFSSVFTGILAITAIFLLHNNVRQKMENLFSKIAGWAALIVALSPTHVEPEFRIMEGIKYTKDYFDDFVIPAVPNPSFFGILHLISALVFFCSLIYLVLCIFTKEEKQEEKQTKSSSDKRIFQYRICGYGMVLSIVLIIIDHLANGNLYNHKLPVTFICETIALWCFGAAWLIKGKFELENIFDNRPK